MSLERSVQDSKINIRLDADIEKFLFLLSPYFLLNTAHKALEWLIHRFHIHQFNKDQFLLLILPYHETRMFVRALQIVELNDPAEKWSWLRPLQNPGVPLSSLTLVQRVATDNGFLQLICNHVLRATLIYNEQANSFSTLYAFYTSALVGGIERSTSITEVQLNHMLPSLAKGLGSSILDFAASSYMIFAKLSTKVRLTNETSEYLLAKALKDPELQYEVMILVFFLYETAHNRMSVVPEKIVSRLANLPWFTDQVVKIKSMGINIAKFIIPFLQTAFECILKDFEESENFRYMINDLFTRVSFDDSEIDLILKNSLKPGIINNDISVSAKDFMADLYRRLERGYPLRFDEYLKGLMTSSETDAGSREVLQFLMSWHSGARNVKDSLDILERLNHYSATQRIAALETIARGGIDITESFRDMVNKALITKFHDDDVRVIKSLLAIPVEHLKSLFASDTLVDELMILLAQCHTEKKANLARPAIQLLLEVCEESDDTCVFIATLPYLFPSSPDEVPIAMQVLNSEFAMKNRYMIAVKADAGACPNAAGIGSAAFHNILKWELLPPTTNILSTMKLQGCQRDATSAFFNLVVLGSVCRVPVGALPNHIAREVIEVAGEMIKQYPKVCVRYLYILLF